MRKQLLAAAVSIAMTIGLSAVVVAPPAQAATTTHHTLTQARTWMVGRWTSGPNSYTGWQRIQITGSHAVVRSCWYPAGYLADDVMHQYPNPLAKVAAPRASRTALLKPSLVCPSIGGVGPKVFPMSWWNPFSWDWGHIVGVTWNTIWNNCLSGAVAGVVGTASGALAVNLIARGGRVFVGPYGYAAIAVGGCVVNLLF